MFKSGSDTQINDMVVEDISDSPDNYFLEGLNCLYIIMAEKISFAQNTVFSSLSSPNLQAFGEITFTKVIYNSTYKMILI